jgi:glycerol transport system substrate-binding protein
MRLRHTSTAMALALLAMGAPAWADMDAAKAFLDAEIGNLSTLSRADQEAEMQWFIDAAKPYAGMEIKVVSETITTHEYESKVLAPAFTAITGIKVTHDLIGEGDVVEKLQTQMQSGENIYDAYVNDSDLIGTHWRYQQARNLTEWMAGEGRDQPHAGPGRLHRAQVHHRPERQPLPAARPAVREPLLVPLRLVLGSEDQGRFQGQVRL